MRGCLIFSESGPHCRTGFPTRPRNSPTPLLVRRNLLWTGWKTRPTGESSKPFFLILAILLLHFAGCSDTRPVTAARYKGGNAEESLETGDDSFNGAIHGLNQIEQLDAGEVQLTIRDRLFMLEAASVTGRGGGPDSFQDALPDLEPMRQAVGRLNQWIGTQDPPASWTRDPLLGGLPADLAALPAVRDLDKLEFSAYDGYCLLEAVWLRDLSNWARGKSADELQQARNLFDWVVRNIQLEPDNPARVPLLPWEVLLWGRGTAGERAWVYLLLLRQQGIDAGLLGLPGRAPSGQAAPPQSAPLRHSCVAVLVHRKEAGRLYLFDTALGLPIPARDGLRLGTPGGLDIQPAALDEVLADRSLVDRMAFSPQYAYWLKSADQKRLVVAVEASPMYLARKSKMVESRLAGSQKMVVSLSATELAERLKKAAGVQSAGLWLLPYQTLKRREKLEPDEMRQQLATLLPMFTAAEDPNAAAPSRRKPSKPQGVSSPLFRGRVSHLKGRLLDTDGAIQFYMAARPAVDELLQEQPRRQELLVQEFGAALRQQIERMPEDSRPAMAANIERTAKGLAHRAVEWETLSLRSGRHDASYWLGLVSYEQGDYRAAMNHFAVQTLDAVKDSPWTSGVHYNLARCQEALGQTKEAIAEQLAGMAVPDDYGSLLRARWLKEALEGRVKTPPQGDKKPRE